jgi:hypothetical protein
MDTIGAVAAFYPSLSPCPNGIRQLFQHFHRCIPVDARIGDTDAFFQPDWAFRGYLLAALVDVGLDHNPYDAILTFAELVANVLSHLGLVLVVLEGIALKSVSECET